MYAERVLRTPPDFEQRAALLASRGLSAPGGEDLVLGLFDEDRLVATGSLVGRIIEGVAVKEELEGQGLTSKLLSLVLKHASDAGIWNLFLFTKRVEVPRFMDLGFRSVASTDSAALLEWGRPGVREFLNDLTFQARNRFEKEQFEKELFEKEQVAKGTLERGRERGFGCIVANCNPFTRGHRYLIETASSTSERLYVIVVEDPEGVRRPVFPFEVRFRLVSEGVQDLRNVLVLRGGEYVISAATFPSYFTQEKEVASVHATLDLEVFASRIAPALSITKRFVGTEPFSPVTNIYNETMKRLLPQHGIAVEELDRMQIDGAPVSASRVRALLAKGDIESARGLVPLCTWRYLNSPEATPVLEKLRE
ncbi:MAG: [citrate (pro-3S)-lyase] ligase [Synergistaceae bacterium]|jgi:[citrate (pro-3S)-lyase] ligase|nr:[citrate (pro-3S)-lyase] ligase [Synergistaceae bacterium]